jgi:hypothetical protein
MTGSTRPLSRKGKRKTLLPHLAVVRTIRVTKPLYEVGERACVYRADAILATLHHLLQSIIQLQAEYFSTRNVSLNNL